MALIDLAEVAPKMFKPLFRNLVEFSISVIQDKELSDQARQNALELMATFSDYAPTMCKKDSSYTSDMITQCLSLMTDIGADDDDAAEWNASDDVNSPLHLASLLLMLYRWSLKKVIKTMLQASSAWIDWPTNLEVKSFSHLHLIGFLE